MKEWLSSIERDYEVEILFACEAGSRMWGLEGPNSDFDVRFIYRHHCLKKYLSLNTVQSTLDFQSPYDASGFDIFKAFALVAKSNPSIYEWAFSPLIYQEAGGFFAQLKKFIETNYSPFSLFKHYGSLSMRNAHELSSGSYSIKKQKQLLQAIRAELIRCGIFKTKAVASPFELISIAKTEHPELYTAYSNISAAKRNNELLEQAEAEKIMAILQLSVKSSEQQLGIPALPPDKEFLNRWIWEILGI
jgi:predicted nucleotidyltransferase